MKSRVILRDGMYFNGELDGFDIPLDADTQFGGRERGVKPKGLVLTALAGCTAMDVISMLRKMRAEPESFSVEADADTADSDPKVFTHIHLTFRAKGGFVAEEKIRKAVELSQNKYCSVSAMLKPTVPISFDIVIG
jgi:putative redox protein